MWLGKRFTFRVFVNNSTGFSSYFVTFISMMSLGFLGYIKISPPTTCKNFLQIVL